MAPNNSPNVETLTNGVMDISLTYPNTNANTNTSTSTSSKMETSSSQFKLLPCPNFSTHLSTEENYRANHQNYFGPYAHIRKTLDYTYHSNYTEDRQRLQNSIIEDILNATQLTDAITGETCTTPTEPWIVFTAGAMGAGKSHTIRHLVHAGRFPLLAFVLADPDEIRRRLPEFSTYVRECPEEAGERTRKEAGYVAEILTLAGLQAGKNVMVDGSLRDAVWYEGYFGKIREEFLMVKIGILHVCAPREAVLERAAKRAKETGRVIPRQTLLATLEQVPKSVRILAPLADYFCELNNIPGATDIELLKPANKCWDNFTSRWYQTCAWVPGKTKQLRNTSPMYRNEDSIKIMKRSKHDFLFSALKTTEENYRTDDSNFYGSNAHLRKQMDYRYHSNYIKERQWLQDSIIEDMLNSAQIADRNGEVCTTPTEPWIVFVAGAMGTGKTHTIRQLVETGRFPLMAFVSIDPDEICRHLPEFTLYCHECPKIISQMTRKESGYIAELLTMAALQARKNVLVYGLLKDCEWYETYFKKLREEINRLKIGILQVSAPKEAVFQWAKKRAETTGRPFQPQTLEQEMYQIPKSIQHLKSFANYYCELNNVPHQDVTIVTKGENWDTFQHQWIQTCAWVPRNGRKDRITEDISVVV